MAALPHDSSDQTNSSKKQSIDIIGIQEHRWKGSEDFNTKNTQDTTWVLYYSNADARSNGGVGILVHKHLYKFISSVKNHQISAGYAPTKIADDEDKDRFYDQFTKACKTCPKHDIVVFFGDMNAQIGHNSQGIAHKNDRKWSWMHPNGYKRELDHIAVTEKWRGSFTNCRAYSKVELNSDHKIVSCHFQLEFSRQVLEFKKHTTFNWMILPNDNEKRTNFQTKLNSALTENLRCNNDISTDKMNNILISTITKAAEETIGKRNLNPWALEVTLKLIDNCHNLKMKYLKQNESHRNVINANHLVNKSYKQDRE
uniref:Endonuclease/exonuclease/phosphatase domain-containing protein n=1 Tax=Octopus bimaculoides TaxID=37653 RepID=A0A0L8GTX1_OCTBM